MSELELAVERRAGDWRIAVAGVMEYGFVEPLRQAVDAALASDTPHVLLELGHVSFVDSTGLALLLTADDLARTRGGSFRLGHPGPQLRRLLETTNLDGRFDLYEG